MESTKKYDPLSAQNITHNNPIIIIDIQTESDLSSPPPKYFKW